MRRNDIAEPPSFNFPDLLDITRGCHAAYKRPRINEPLVLRERNFLLRNLSLCAAVSALSSSVFLIREPMPFRNSKKRNATTVECRMLIIFKLKDDV